MQEAVDIMLRAMGIDMADENFKDTPKRVAKAYSEILRYQDKNDLDSFLLTIIDKSFPTDYTGIVAQKKIKAISMCPHHMQPIHYEIDIGYVAKDKALGLSKITRAVEALAARMVLQETLTDDIADFFAYKIKAKGVIIIVRGKHGCMSNRGVKQEIVTTTSSIRGIFEEDWPLRQEFLALNA